jgi:acetyl-CoA C-acetyltransferase
MKDAYIVSACRTAIAKDKGALVNLTPEVYAAEVVKEAVKRSGVTNLETIDELLFGQCYGYQYSTTARVVALKAGLPVTVPTVDIDRQCATGATVVNVAATQIWAGIGDIYVAGGVESMTRVPYILEKPDESFQRRPLSFLHPQVAPTEFGDLPNGVTAEKVAEQYGVSREEQDEFGLLSQLKAERAIKEGRFKDQIIPITIPQRKGEPVVFDTDEHPRFGSTIEALAKLRPAFKQGGTVTAATSSGITDGAGAMVLMSGEKTKELGVSPLAKVVAFAYGGVDPTIMGVGPVPATRKVLAKSGLTIDQMDVIELNEAFASQCIASCNELGIDWRNREKFNPNGGAIALGHPIAASLAILMIKAIYELKRTNKKYALITACVAGGLGVATIIERAG